MNRDPKKSSKASLRTGSVDNDVPSDEAPSPELNDLPPQRSALGIYVSFSLLLENKASAPSKVPNEVVAPQSSTPKPSASTRIAA